MPDSAVDTLSVPFCARSKPVLVMPLSRPWIVMMPAPSELMVPLLTIALPLPLTNWPCPIWPLTPRIVTPDAIVSVLLPPSTPIRLLPAAPNTMLPEPPSACVPSMLTTLLASMLNVPLTVMPLMTRTNEVALAMSIVLPLVSVTPER